VLSGEVLGDEEADEALSILAPAFDFDKIRRLGAASGAAMPLASGLWGAMYVPSWAAALL
jgi:hypothetical protein